MKRSVVVLLVAALVAAPAAQGQWISDPEGDTREMMAGQEVGHGRSGAADVLAVDLQETETELRFTVDHSPLPTPTMPVMDAVVYSMEFRHGKAGYELVVILNVPADAPPGYRAALYEAGDFTPLAQPGVEETSDGFAVTLAKEWIPDELGTTPTLGGAITDFVLNARSTGFFNICLTEEGCMSLTPNAVDRAPNQDPGASFAFQYGLEQDGDIRLRSAAPMRWSNGEATTFVYELVLENHAKEEDTLTLRAKDVPESWQVANVGPVTVPAGQSATIPLPVRVPFGHAHGTTPTFILEAYGIHGTGRIELGVHYPAIPQPTGHHAELTLHTRDVPDTIGETLMNALGGGYGAIAYMNADSNHDGDESVPVPGHKSGLAVEFEDDDTTPKYYAVEYSWFVPLSPGLRVGLAATDEQTSGSAQLAFDVAAGDLRVGGRVAVVDRTELADSGFPPDTQMGETLATIPFTDVQAIQSQVTVPFTVHGEDLTVPFDPEQELVLILWSHVIRPDSILTPNMGVHLLEGDLVLPLEEYHDALPVNVTFPEEVVDEALRSLDGTGPLDEEQGAPAPGAFGLLAALGLAAAARRLRP